MFKPVPLLLLFKGKWDLGKHQEGSENLSFVKQLKTEFI